MVGDGDTVASALIEHGRACLACVSAPPLYVFVEAHNGKQKVHSDRVEAKRRSNSTARKESTASAVPPPRGKKRKMEQGESDFDRLPDELLSALFRHVPCVTRLAVVATVCRRWRAVSLDAAASGTLCIGGIGDRKDDESEKDDVRVHVKRHQRIESAVRAAACAGHVACVLGMSRHTHGTWPHDVIDKAIAMGQNGTARMLVSIGCPWTYDPMPLARAAARDDTGMMDWLRNRGCVIDFDEVAQHAVSNGAIRSLAWLADFDPEEAARSVFVPAHAAGHTSVAYLRALSELGAWPLKSVDICRAAAVNGRLECLVLLRALGCPWNASTTYWAARGGHIECLVYAHTNGCEWYSDTCTAAAEGGHLDCLEYAHTHGCPWNAGACVKAARGGHLECLRYLHTRGCPWDEDTCALAAQNGHVDCLRYAHENGCPWNENVYSDDAHQLSMECIWYAVERGCPFDESPLIMAIKHGMVDDVVRAHRDYSDVVDVRCDPLFCAVAGSPFDMDIFTYLLDHGYEYKPMYDQYLARQGHLDALQLIHVRGVEWNFSSCAIAAAQSGHVAVLEWMRGVRPDTAWPPDALGAAITRYDDNCMQFLCRTQTSWDDLGFMDAFNSVPNNRAASMLLRAGCLDRVDVWSEGRHIKHRFMKIAAASGDLDLMREMRARRWPFARDTLAVACFRYPINMDMVRYLCDRGCPWDIEASKNAATQGNVGALRMFYERGYPFHPDVCAAAALGGHLLALAYARECGCLWDVRVCTRAIQVSSLVCLDYAHRHGCPWDTDTYKQALSCSNPVYAQYMLAHGWVPT